MDRESLWTRRNKWVNPCSPPNRKPTYIASSCNRPGPESQKEIPGRNNTSSRHRFSGGEPSSGRASLSNGIPPLNTNTSAPAGKSSAFGLGSGAFASFGSSAKTPKTPGTALDPSRSSTIVESPPAETDVQPQASTKHASSSSKSLARSQSSKDADTKPQLPLKNPWIVWYRPPTAKHSDYEKSIKAVYKMSTVQEFWQVYAHLKRPSTLPTVSDYHLFRDGMRPVWEDDANKQGGKWIMRIKKGLIDRYWEEILLAIIGDQFAEAGEDVCGLVISVRSGEDVFSVWTKYDNGRNVKIRETIKRVLNLPVDTNLTWKSHDDSIAQRSAIDQARQEKGNTDKRRNTLVNNEHVLSSKEKGVV